MPEKKPFVVCNAANNIADNNNTYAGQYSDYQLPFTSILAHHVKDPLTSISLAVGLLEGTAFDNTQQTYLSFIKKNYLRINNLMDLLLVQQSCGEMPLQECSVQKFIDDSIGILNERIILENILVSKDYDEEDCTVMINESKMKVALVNILVNSIDAMSPKKGTLKLSTKIAAGKYCVEIKDNGCGINKEHLKYIFLPSYSNKPNATGMGLALTYDILKANDVELDIQSEEDEGTSFILFFNNIISKQYRTL